MCYFLPGFDIILTKKTHFPVSQMYIYEKTNFQGGGGGGGAIGIGIVIEKLKYDCSHPCL